MSSEKLNKNNRSINWKFLWLQILGTILLSSGLSEFSVLMDIDIMTTYFPTPENHEDYDYVKINRLIKSNYYYKLFGWIGIFIGSIITLITAKKLALRWVTPCLMILLSIGLKIIGFWDFYIFRMTMCSIRLFLSSYSIQVAYLINGIILTGIGSYLALISNVPLITFLGGRR